MIRLLICMISDDLSTRFFFLEGNKSNVMVAVGVVVALPVAVGVA